MKSHFLSIRRHHETLLCYRGPAFSGPDHQHRLDRQSSLAWILGADRLLRVRHAFTGVGMCIGEWFRRFTHPDWISTSGAVETFKAKVFWLMGPQAIGALIGFFAFQGFMNNILGYAV
jgi:hypothetical protein